MKARLKKIFPQYNQKLPISSHCNEIIDSIRQNQIIILAGETGSGKTTQIPKICLEAGRGTMGLIGCTQPRRIAALSVASRLSEELNDPHLVGTQIRFYQHIHPDNRIRVMTDGILLAQAQSEPKLGKYDTLIIDEAHERSVNIDVILGMLRLIVEERDELKLIITSATLDIQKFSRHFDNAPVISVSGRTYPVDIVYKESEEKEELSLSEKIVDTLEELLYADDPGDILVFLPTEQDINECVDAISKEYRHKLCILPLYSRLSVKEQKKVFKTDEKRKIIVATNIAETSLTIPGVKFVIDSGYARLSRYYPGTGIQGLPVERISRASADQRAGRCGRTGKGKCFRLYSLEDYLARPAFTEPEIMRTNLAGLILRLLNLGITDLESFPLIDPPSSAGIRDGLGTLQEIAAIQFDSSNKRSNRKEKRILTHRGRLISRLPLEPRLACVLIVADSEGCLGEVMPVVAALSVQDPRENSNMNGNRKSFNDSHSDFLTWLNIWDGFHNFMPNHSFSSRLKKFCRDYAFSFRRMREWIDIHSQLEKFMKDNGYNVQRLRVRQSTNVKTQFPEFYKVIHCALLSGFLSHIIQKDGLRQYKASRGPKVYLHPSSILTGGASEWILAMEFVKTNRLYAKSLAEIDVEWLELIGRDFLMRSWKNPRWSFKKKHVVATEEARLFGFLVYNDKEIVYGMVKPAEARAIFIRSALVEGDMDIERYDFLMSNRKLLEDLRVLENKLRRRDILVGEDELAGFYLKRIPSHVHDLSGMDKYIREHGDALLRMREDDVSAIETKEWNTEDFPDSFVVDGERWPLSYEFDVESENDGITLKIASRKMPPLPGKILDWMVPGLMLEKIEQLMRGLEKQYRRKLIPIAQTAREIFEGMDRGIPVLTAIGEWIYKNKGVHIPVQSWKKDNLPDYLRLRLSLTNDAGEIIASTREDLLELLNISRESKKKINNSLRNIYEIGNLKKWPNALDVKIMEPALTDNGVNLWLALKAEGESVGLRLFDNRMDAEAAQLNAQVLLAQIYWSRELKRFRSELCLTDNLYSEVLGESYDIESAIWEMVLTDIFAVSLIRDSSEWQSLLSELGRKIYPMAREQMMQADEVLECYVNSKQILIKMHGSSHRKQFIRECLMELDDLAGNNFVSRYPRKQWQALCRWMNAVVVRARNGSNDPSKENRAMKLWTPYKTRLDSIINQMSEHSSQEKRDAVSEVSVLIQDLKVKMFASSEIRVPGKISEAQISSMLEQCELML